MATTTTDRRRFLRAGGAAAPSVPGAALLSTGASAQTEITTEYRRPPAVPSATLIDGIYYVVLDAPDDYGRGYQHGAALRYVIHRGIAQWRQWINEFLGKQDVEAEIAEFIHDTNFLTGVRAHTPELYEELKGIGKGAGVDFNTIYAYQMFDEFVVYALSKYRLSGCSGFGGPWPGRPTEYPGTE